MGYVRLPGSDERWTYDGLEIQADIETHRFTVAFAREHLSRSARVLDVGAGTGSLGKQLSDLGCDVSCTSWDGRVRAPLPVHTLDLDHPFGPEAVGGQYDMVCCLEVIEHVENPSALLRSLRSIVRPDGLVVLSTPNIESVQSRLQFLLHGYPLIFHGNEITRNRHISMMWREGLEFLIDRAGLLIREKRMIGPARLRTPVQRLLKMPVYWALARALPGEVEGETRLYVLTAAAAAAKTGPADVY